MKKKTHAAVANPPANGQPSEVYEEKSQSPHAGESHSKVSLRRKAEAQFREREDLSQEKIAALSHEEMGTILHELRVHQIELEMQNEELRRSEEDLDASRARYFDLYDLAPVGYVTVTGAGLILEANLTATTLLGLARPALVPRPFSRFVLKEDQDIYYKRRQQLTETGELQTCDLRMVKADGTEFFAHLKITAAPGKNGEPEYRVVLTDIAARKQAESEILRINRQLEEATAKAEMATESKSEFLANMSHEIRTPLNGVIAMNSLLLESGLNDKQRHYAKIACSSGMALLTLINDILDFSKIEAGKLDLETLNFDLSGLLADCAVTMAGWAHGKGLELICAADPGVPALLRGDPNRLNQILANLAGNAIKFTNSGSVAIRVSMTSETEREATLRFSVRDTGIAIPKDKLGGLFEKFTQADASTTRKFGGTGLGLAITKQLVELMGGEIGAESEPGKGSEFWFVLRLPKQPSHEPDQPPANLRDASVPVVDDNATNRFAGRNARILVAEDDFINQLVVRGIFEMLGLKVDLVANGAEAVEAIKTSPYDLVFMDGQMPVMDGYMATKAVRKLETENRKPEPGGPAPSFRRIPIIALTANCLKGDREKCMDAGMDGYLSKPVSVKSMSEVLEKWLPADAGSL